MNLQFNTALAKKYKNPTQIARVLSEDWTKQQVYCPNCGNDNLEKYENNRPVADFLCPKCNAVYEMNYPAAELRGIKGGQGTRPRSKLRGIPLIKLIIGFTSVNYFDWIITDKTYDLWNNYNIKTKIIKDAKE